MLSDVSIFTRLFDPTVGGFAPDVARYILTLDVIPAEQARAATLAEKAQAGTLTSAERADIDAPITADTGSTVVRCRARAALCINEVATQTLQFSK